MWSVRVRGCEGDALVKELELLLVERLQGRARVEEPRHKGEVELGVARHNVLRLDKLAAFDCLGILEHHLGSGKPRSHL